MKILSTFTNTKEDILNVYSKYGNIWQPATVLLPTFFRISSFVLNKRKKLTGLEQLEEWVNDDRISILGWTILLNMHCTLQQIKFTWFQKYNFTSI